MSHAFSPVSEGDAVTLPAFDLLQPESLRKALEFLDENRNARPLAGGTCLLVDLRKRTTEAEILLDLTRVRDLRGIRIEEDELVIGAATTIAEVLADSLVEEHAGVLHDACRTFAAPLVRNRATLGGNLVHASPAADTAPPLLVLDASIELQAIGRRRVVPITNFFTGPCESTRREDEILTSVRIPIFNGVRHAYTKLGQRKADAISVVSVACLAIPGEGPRIALGAVAPRPTRAWDAEEILKGVELTPETAKLAAKVASEEARPIDDLRGSAAYRRREVEVLVRRCLRQLIDDQGGDVDGS